MRKAKFAIPALAAALLFINAKPADAYSQYASCSAGSGYRLAAEAQIGFEVDLFYQLTGGHEKSNVNIEIRRSNGTTRWSYNSPDNRQPGIRYYVLAPLRLEMGDRVRFTAIFDRPIFSDPRCTASTPPYEGQV
jgi:hypothetical protein